MKLNKRSTRLLFFAGVAAPVIVAIAILIHQTSASTQNPPAAAKPDSPSNAGKQVHIDLDKAVAIALPSMREDLKPAAFKTPDSKTGWVIRIPGGRPISTPAYADGMIFVGGGYGSHEFYAFNAETGALMWQAKTSDDGPTAAVVEDGYVAFNTESCTVIVCEAKTGKTVWQEWLGDPLMSQPAISKGRLYIAYPAGQRGHQQANPQIGNQTSQQNSAEPTSQRSRTGHRLLCADLKTGRHIWEQDISADVISAPVLNADQVYFTCFDGTSFCLTASDGSVVWKKQNSGTSAPLVADGQVVMTQKETRGKSAYEGLKRIDAARGVEKDKELLAASKADYLGEGKGGGVGLGAAEIVTLDSSVGFSSAPPSANLSVANKQVGVNSVVGGWAYQGSRAAHKGGQMMNAQGRFLNNMRASDGRFNWRAEIKGSGVNDDSQVFSPPALGERNMYLCSSQGHLVAVNQQDGAIKFLYSTKQPITFQPALAGGNVYAGTANGLLICLRTGEKDADGWYAWGGNAQHNK